MEKEKTVVNAVLCPNCNHYIYSCTSHDFHECPCGAITVDGGFDYMHFGWVPSLDYKDIKENRLEILASKKQLYNDWNLNLKTPRKYGTIHKNKAKII